jgi:hypothetical protein
MRSPRLAGAIARLQRSPDSDGDDGGTVALDDQVTDVGDDNGLVVIDDQVSDGDTEVVGLTGQSQDGLLNSASDVVSSIFQAVGNFFVGDAQAAAGGAGNQGGGKKAPPRWITTINVDLAGQGLTFTWSDGQKSTSHTISSGRGRPCTRTDPCKTQTEPNCTPVGTYTVNGLGNASTANSEGDAMAWFVGIGIRGIGIHNSQNADGTPRSHGCIRVGKGDAAEAFAKLINNNVREGQTLIVITGKAPTKPWKPPTGCPPGGGQKRQGGAKKVQRAASPQSAAGGAPASVERVLAAPGEPLPAGLRQFMEAGFGQDFAHVRVHTDARAQESAADVSARAYTVGSDIVFGKGEYEPNSSAGRRMVAHELTHVIQQTEAPSNSAGVDAHSSVAAPQVQRDLLDDAMSFATGTYDSVASAVSDAAEATKAAASQAITTISDDVDSAASTVASAGEAAGAFVSSVGATASTDPEKTRANLLTQVSSARAKVQSADPDTIVADPEHAASLNQNIGRLNAALPSTAAAVPAVLPALVPIAEAIGAILEAIVAAILGATAALILIIAIIILAIIALILYFFKGPMPGTKPQTEPTTEPKDAPAPEPEPEPKPGPEPKPVPGPVDPIPPRPECSPTGLTPDDPIPVTWFKPRIDSYYPSVIIVAGIPYGRDDGPTHLPTGEPIGVAGQYWPFVGKILQLVPEVDEGGRVRFRAVLERYGFDWTGLDADHVQDLEFGGPDDSGFINLWPLDSSANRSAGASTNGQTIRVCLRGPSDPAPVSGQLSKLKGSLYGRYFIIRAVVIAPPASNG